MSEVRSQKNNGLFSLNFLLFTVHCFSQHPQRAAGGLNPNRSLLPVSGGRSIPPLTAAAGLLIFGMIVFDFGHNSGYFLA